MLTRFFTPVEYIDYFKRGELKDDLLNGGVIAIGSIADLLDICEAYKKGGLKISGGELHQKFSAFEASVIKEGFVFIVDLDQEGLSTALFEKDNEMVELWQQAANRGISPKQSIRCLTLKIADDSAWWSENVYEEMEEYHISENV